MRRLVIRAVTQTDGDS